MNLQSKRNWWRRIFVAVGGVIIVSSVFYINRLVNGLEQEERKKMELVAAAIGSLDTPSSYLLLFTQIQESNTTIPLFLVNDEGVLLDYKNIDLTEEEKEAGLSYLLEKIDANKEPIEIEIHEGTTHKIYYANSDLLNSLIFYPYLQFLFISIIILMAFMAYTYTQESEKKQVWVGLSKETAHQLGTPISSLMAWVEILKEGHNNPMTIGEIEKDVNRLKIVSDRFSKVGSLPTLQVHNVCSIVKDTMDYMRLRAAGGIRFELVSEAEEVEAILDKELFTWVVENLIKNAIDAIGKSGEIKAQIAVQDKYVLLDISDTGKGLPSNKFNTIFDPGYTTKKRGWGLGLSLAKRIIKDYHKGKIFVKYSELNKGTIFRVQIAKKT